MLSRIANFLFKHKDDPKQIFLIDAFGALITAISLVGILAQLEYLFGMPAKVLYILAGVAFCLCLYSTSCYLFVKSNRKPYVRLIIIFNFSYIVLSVGMIIIYYKDLTKLGLIYFIIEIIIIGIIIIIEYKLLKTLRNDN